MVVRGTGRFGAAHVLLLHRRGRALGDFPRADRLARHVLLRAERFVIGDALLTIEETRALQALVERRERIFRRRTGHRHRLMASHAAAGGGGKGGRRARGDGFRGARRIGRAHPLLGFAGDRSARGSRFETLDGGVMNDLVISNFVRVVTTTAGKGQTGSADDQQSSGATGDLPRELATRCARNFGGRRGRLDYRFSGRRHRSGDRRHFGNRRGIGNVSCDRSGRYRCGGSRTGALRSARRSGRFRTLNCAGRGSGFDRCDFKRHPDHGRRCRGLRGLRCGNRCWRARFGDGRRGLGCRCRRRCDRRGHRNRRRFLRESGGGGQDQERGNRARGGAGEGDIFHHSEGQTNRIGKPLRQRACFHDEPWPSDGAAKNSLGLVVAGHRFCGRLNRAVIRVFCTQIAVYQGFGGRE